MSGSGEGVAGRTHVDDADVEAERVAREISNVPHVIAQIEDRSRPVGYCRPDGHPADNLRIQLRHALPDRDIINRVVEQRYQARDAHHGQRLARQHTKDQGRQCRREKGFIDAEVAARVPRHVELKGQGGEQVDEEDAHGGGEGAVVEAVLNVAPVVGQSSSYVPVHASERAGDAVGAPSCQSLPGVWVVGEVGGHSQVLEVG